MTTRNVTIGWVHPETEEEFRVTGRLYLGSPARGPTYDCAGEPADPPEYEVEKVIDESGHERPDLIDLAQETLDAIDYAAESVRDERAAAAEDAADAARDDARMEG